MNTLVTKFKKLNVSGLKLTGFKGSNLKTPATLCAVPLITLGLAACSSTHPGGSLAHTEAHENETVEIHDPKSLSQSNWDETKTVIADLENDESKSTSSAVTQDEKNAAIIEAVEDFARDMAIRFDFDSAVLDEQSKEKLDALVGLVSEYTGNEKLSLVVEGHADAIGSKAYNKELSEDRAEAVMAYLREKSKGTLAFEVKALGESDPVATNETVQGREKNRRSELRFEGTTLEISLSSE